MRFLNWNISITKIKKDAEEANLDANKIFRHKLIDIEVESRQKISTIINFCIKDPDTASKLLEKEGYFFVARKDSSSPYKTQLDIIWNVNWGDVPLSLNKNHCLAFYKAFQNGDLKEILKLGEEKEFINETTSRMATEVIKEVQQELLAGNP